MKTENNFLANGGEYGAIIRSVNVENRALPAACREKDQVSESIAIAAGFYAADNHWNVNFWSAMIECISGDYCDKAFPLFQRLHSKNDCLKARPGLATCKKNVEQHGGNTWAESEIGKGTKFYFTIKTGV